MTLFNMKENRKYLTSTRSRLSLEQLCPQWAKKLKSGLDEQDIRMLAHNSKFCIVGEAWKYGGRHTVPISTSMINYLSILLS